VWIHGGGWRGGSKDRCFIDWLTEQGYAVSSISYRLTDKATFPAQLHDCKGAIRWLRAHAQEYGYSTDRIAVAGSSAGGHLAALLGVTRGIKDLEGDVGGHLDFSSHVDAIVDYYGPTDFVQRTTSQPHKTVAAGSPVNLLLGGPANEKVELARLASPVFHVTADDPPLQIFHGDKDKTVLLAQSERMVAAYQAAERPVTLHVLEGSGHGGAEFFTGENRTRLLEFLAQHLREATPKKTSAIPPNPRHGVDHISPASTILSWPLRNVAVREEAAVARPNILLLFADDLGYETLNCYGGTDFETPHLDRLAGQGMRFNRAYTSPVCTPSRMSLYTGTYAPRHGYYNVLPVHLGTKQAVDFRNTWRTFPQLLRGAGYLTSVTGKWQLAALEFHPDHCRDAGFDSWCVWQIWRNGAKTTRYWQPCFNHDGTIRDDIADRFGPDVLADYVIDQMRTAIAAKRPFYIHHNMLLPHWPISPTPDDKSAGRDGSLAGMIRYLDKLCGRIVDEVDRLGIAEETIVIFMGDNGTDQKAPRVTKQGEVRGGKTDLNDAGTHIPLLVRQTGVIEAGATSDDLIDMADWFPTMCELAGVTIPEELRLDGVSFASTLHGTGHSPRKYVVGGYNNAVSIFDGQW
ncbi:MAG: sulfatase-like hydrolase/transferase, partial [Planctomycetaceae bacterium]|nr:sulfatase-like hydrolase/transferase [Planctomycetaceae bacterium]